MGMACFRLNGGFQLQGRRNQEEILQGTIGNVRGVEMSYAM